MLSFRTIPTSVMNSRNIRPQAVNLVECVKWSVSAAGGRRPPKHKSLSAVYAAHICCSKRLSPCAASSMLFMSARHSLICCWRRRSCSKTLSPSAQLVLFFNLRRRECQGEDPATWNRTCGFHWTYHTFTLKKRQVTRTWNYTISTNHKHYITVKACTEAVTFCVVGNYYPASVTMLLTRDIDIAIRSGCLSVRPSVRPSVTR